MKRNGVIGIIAVVVILGILGVVGISLSNNSQNSSSNSSQSATGANSVEIKSYAFNPTPITVKVGTKVTWTNQDAVGHTVTSDDSSAETFKSELLKQGTSYSYTFSKAGTFTYHCIPHVNMHGTVTVTN